MPYPLRRLWHYGKRLFPSTCLWCQQSLEPSSDQLCTDCHQHLPRLDARLVQHNALFLPAVFKSYSHVQFDALYTLSWYQPPYKQWIRRWKFSEGHAEGELLCQLLQEKAAELEVVTGALADAVSFVPISKKRLAERGFNQAHQLAKQLAAQWQRPCLALFDSPALVPHQTGLSRHERLKNLAGKIQLNSGQLPEHIALVDDVITTGATLDYLTRLLKKAGVKRVDVWCLAITPYSAASSKASSPSPAHESVLNILLK